MTYQIVSERRMNNPGAIKDPNDIYNLVKRYQKEQKEHFIVITLDGVYAPISVSLATIGLVNKTIIHPREVFIRAIRDMATAIAICHNHPSGSLEVNADDMKVTERLCKAGNLLGINVVDHIIFSKRGYISMREQGYFNNFETTF